jgi:16S rRNA (adenine1518-N6/adenine1519-N6)-dimethyltransferase
VGARPEIISYVPKNSFWPSPKVDSAIIKIIPRGSFRRSDLRNLFFWVVRAGFSQPRKQLLNNLSKGLALSVSKGLKLNKPRSRVSSLRGKEFIKSLPRSEKKSLLRGWLLKNNIQPTQRAETLSIEDWINLAKTYAR